MVYLDGEVVTQGARRSANLLDQDTLGRTPPAKAGEGALAYLW
jgi:hypothetical protein